MCIPIIDRRSLRFFSFKIEHMLGIQINPVDVFLIEIFVNKYHGI